MSAEQTPDIERVLTQHEGCVQEYLFKNGFEFSCGFITPIRSYDEASRAHLAQALAPVLAAAVRDAEQRASDECEAKKIAAGAADRFRDVLSECLGHPDENPGDDVLVAEVRERFGKSGPEPTRWRDFCSGALAIVDQINAARADRVAEPQHEAATSSGESEASDE